MTHYIDTRYGRWEVLAEFPETHQTVIGTTVEMMVKMRSVSSGQVVTMPFSQMEVISRMGVPSEKVPQVGDLYHKGKPKEESK